MPPPLCRLAPSDECSPLPPGVPPAPEPALMPAARQGEVFGDIETVSGQRVEKKDEAKKKKE